MENKTKPHGELFYIDEDGNKKDAPLHDEILNSVSPEDEMDILHQTRARAKNVHGLTSEEIDSLYPVSHPDETGMAKGGVSQLPKPPGLNHSIESMVMRGSSYNLHHAGMIRSSVPGRTDKLKINVPSGSYIIPADIPSALGEGNTDAGGAILKRMFTSGPYGLPLTRHTARIRHLSTPLLKRAEGGEADQNNDNEKVPIIAAGGEFVVYPDIVRQIGDGDMKRGHDILDKFVLHTRKEHIKTLKKLKPPKK